MSDTLKMSWWRGLSTHAISICHRSLGSSLTCSPHSCAGNNLFVPSMSNSSFYPCSLGERRILKHKAYHGISVNQEKWAIISKYKGLLQIKQFERKYKPITSESISHRNKVKWNFQRQHTKVDISSLNLRSTCHALKSITVHVFTQHKSTRLLLFPWNSRETLHSFCLLLKGEVRQWRRNVRIDHFRVVFHCANKVVLMLTSWHLHDKSREVCIKAWSPPASLAFMVM